MKFNPSVYTFPEMLIEDGSAATVAVPPLILKAKSAATKGSVPVLV